MSLAGCEGTMRWDVSVTREGSNIGRTSVRYTTGRAGNLISYNYDLSVCI